MGKSSNIASPTVAIRTANLFDGAKDAVLADLRKPAVDSVVKKTASVGFVMGIGAAIGYALA